jgi:UTP--glucose-1-phosphate uridylyltransferase
VQLRDSVADVAFDPALFERLRAGLRAGTLSQAAARLSAPPVALDAQSTIATLGGPPGKERAAQLAERGLGAIRAGRVASLVLNGGMATRFGGGAKGAVAVVEGEPETFLSLKLGACARLARELQGALPVIVMNSFATRTASLEHLDEIDWGGVPVADRYTFDQSIMPRITAEGDALAELDLATTLPDTDVYSAPGHGDTVGRLRDSGVLARLRARGVEHVLISNVDNLGASVDPTVLGAHLAAADDGGEVTVEVVTRREGDAGGCVAAVEGRPIIVEGFRLPADTDLTAFPHFNTNTLWVKLEALDRELPLTWFPVRKRVALADGREVEAIQFERLIGQITEFLDSRYQEVDRDARFLPVKTRDDLSALAPIMRELIAARR